MSSTNEAYAARYRVVCDASWRVHRADVDLIGTERYLRLVSDGDSRWSDVAGNAFPHLDGAIDIDLTASPFTNSLPIRRLDLHRGQSANIRTAYISVPDLTVTVDSQRYTCIEERKRYRFVFLDSGFVREIETDNDGLVVSYPGLFRRVL